MADLVTTAEVQTYLGISNEDALIAQLITLYQDAVKNYCGLEFEQEAITEYLDGGAQNLIVTRPPIDSITGVYDNYDDDEEVDSDDYTNDPNAGLIFFSEGSTSTWGSGRRRWKVIYTGDYDGAPNPVKLALFMLISKTLNNRDPFKTSENIGDYGYSISPLVLSKSSWPPEVKALLNQYKAVRFF